MKNLVLALLFVLLAAPARAGEKLPLDQPVMDNAALLEWAAAAARDTMTFTYQDYLAEMQKAGKYFTKTGWEGFTKLLQKSYILDTVQAQKQTVTAETPVPPKLVAQQVQKNTRRWVMDLPLKLTYTGGTQTRTDAIHLRLVVQRVSDTENAAGVAIDQWIVHAAQKIK